MEDCRYLKVEGHSYLVRDTVSNAIVNKNSTEYQNYKNLRKVKDQEKQRLEKLETDVDEIKSLLRQLIYKEQ
jgi:hypothetical protein